MEFHHVAEGVAARLEVDRIRATITCLLVEFLKQQIRLPAARRFFSCA
jgi:hypothetical protein